MVNLVLVLSIYPLLLVTTFLNTFMLLAFLGTFMLLAECKTETEEFLTKRGGGFAGVSCDLGLDVVMDSCSFAFKTREGFEVAASFSFLHQVAE